MAESKHVWFCVVDIESLESRVLAPTPDKGQWRLGIPGSGAAIEIAEPLLSGVELFVRGASNHLLLEGQIPKGALLPAIGFCALCKSGEWKWEDPARMYRTLRDGKLYVRFDYNWLRIGRCALRASWDRTAFDEAHVDHRTSPKAKPWWRRLFGSAGQQGAAADDRPQAGDRG